jgi:hypothetical protein
MRALMAAPPARRHGATTLAARWDAFALEADTGSRTPSLPRGRGGNGYGDVWTSYTWLGCRLG